MIVACILKSFGRSALNTETPRTSWIVHWAVPVSESVHISQSAVSSQLSSTRGGGLLGLESCLWSMEKSGENSCPWSLLPFPIGCLVVTLTDCYTCSSSLSLLMVIEEPKPRTYNKCPDWGVLVPEQSGFSLGLPFQKYITVVRAVFYPGEKGSRKKRQPWSNMRVNDELTGPRP